VPDALDQYWQLTLRFLISRRMSGPASSKRTAGSNRRPGATKLIEAEAARLTQRHDGPVIAAGSNRLDAGDREISESDRRIAAGCGGAAGARQPISTTMRGN